MKAVQEKEMVFREKEEIKDKFTKLVIGKIKMKKKTLNTILTTIL